MCPQANPIACVGTAVQDITTNVTTLAGDLRTAAGPKVPIIGSTYPDVILGSYVYPMHPAPPATISLAKVSVTAFKALINPALSKGYASAKGSLVDVTAASGAYGPLTKTVKTKKLRADPGAGRQGLPADVVLLEGRHPLQEPGATT